MTDAPASSAAPGTGEHHHVSARRTGHRLGWLAERRDDRLEAPVSGLDDPESVHLTQEQELARGAHAHGTGPHHHGAHRLLQFRTAELAPTALLEGDGAAALEPHAGGGDGREHEGQSASADGPHRRRPGRGASWNRTSDLTLIRGAL
jgi:hypothetical protein